MREKSFNMTIRSYRIGSKCKEKGVVTPLSIFLKKYHTEENGE
jgi:hypothetical protein